MTTGVADPKNLRSVFLSLQEANFDAVVVGSQALNLWATKYVVRAPELGELLPLFSARRCLIEMTSALAEILLQINLNSALYCNYLP